MKDMMKKMLAALAALAVTVSVVMPCAAGGEDDIPSFEIWDEEFDAIRD